ncbi:MAG: flavin reductase family protein [Epsilonproteobacteria bacterium]|nr:flavin reductase family protein [Campylobacterota bacterium]
MIVDFNKIPKALRYKLTSNLIIPRPIAWISTLSKEKVLNLAPFSYFTPLSSAPPTLLVSIGHKKDNSPKDTLKNLRETKKASITIATYHQTSLLHLSATPLDYNISEFKEFNIKTSIIEPNYPPIPQNSKVSFFCKYLKEIELEGSSTIPVILTIESLFIDDSLIKDKEKLDIEFKEAIARVGSRYFKLNGEIEI